MAKKITCKKEVERILTEMNKSEQVAYNPYDENGNTFIRIADQKSSFRCDFPEGFEDELRKRAGSIDYHLKRRERKMEGGINTQKAILFVMNNRDEATKVKIAPAKYRNWNDPYNAAYINNKMIARVDFSAADFDYALNCVRVG